MKDPVYQSELAHDAAGFSDAQIEPFMREAMDSLIDDLFTRGLVGRIRLQFYVEDFAENIAASLITGEPSNIRSDLERMIRREFEDSEIVRERAIEMMGEGEE